MGLDAEIPDHLPALRVRSGVEVRRWPSVYLTPRVRALMALYELHRDGVPLLAEPGVLWPAPLTAALRAIRIEREIAEVPRG
jgi:hypothetical protein